MTDSLLESSDVRAVWRSRRSKAGKAVGGRGWLLALLHTARRCYSYGQGSGKKNEGWFYQASTTPLISCFSPLAGKMTDREFVAWLGLYRPRYTHQRENGIDADGAFYSCQILPDTPVKSSDSFLLFLFFPFLSSISCLAGCAIKLLAGFTWPWSGMAWLAWL